MKKVYAAIVVLIALCITFVCTSNYVVGKIDHVIDTIDASVECIKDDDYESALQILNHLKDDMENTTNILEKILVHDNVEETMRSIDEAIVYCDYQVKQEAIKELLGAKYLLENLKDVETFSLRSIF